MQPLESVDLENRVVTKRAARGITYLAEQAAGLRALAAAHLVTDGHKRVPLQPIFVRKSGRSANVGIGRGVRLARPSN